MCIICQQYLYLSAVVCDCRPSAFVCLEVCGNCSLGYYPVNLFV